MLGEGLPAARGPYHDGCRGSVVLSSSPALSYVGTFGFLTHLEGRKGEGCYYEPMYASNKHRVQVEVPQITREFMEVLANWYFCF